MKKQKELEQIYKMHADELYSFSFFRTQSKEESEDVVSEAFIKLYQDDAFEDIKNKRAWLFKVTRNMIYNNYRDNKHTELTVDLPDEELIEKSISSVEKTVIDQETVVYIEDKLRQLDNDSADIVIMKIWDGMKFSEIAEVVSMSVDAVKKRFYRAISELKILISREEKSLKLRSITIPALVAGIFGIATQPAYAISASSGAAIASGLGSTLGFTFSNMASTVIAGSAVGATAPTVAAGGGILASTTAKILAATTLVIAGAGIGTGGVILYNSSQDDTPQEDNEIIEETDLSKTFTSELYDVTFQYPAEMGESMTTLTTGFDNELITFTNSELSIAYPHFEGAAVCDVIEDETISAENKRFQVCVWTQGVNDNLFGVSAINFGAHTDDSIVFLTQEIMTMSEVTLYLDQIQSILDTLEYDLTKRSMVDPEETTIELSSASYPGSPGNTINVVVPDEYNTNIINNQTTVEITDENGAKLVVMIPYEAHGGIIDSYNKIGTHDQLGDIYRVLPALQPNNSSETYQFYSDSVYLRGESTCPRIYTTPSDPNNFDCADAGFQTSDIFGVHILSYCEGHNNDPVVLKQCDNMLLSLKFE